MSKVGPEDGEKPGETFKEGGKLDLSKGPKKDRSPTDIVCCIIFVVHIVVFFIFAFMGAGAGNPHKLIVPRDYAGDYCSVSSQWRSESLDYSKFEKALYTLNVSETIDPVASSLICSSAMKSILTNANVISASEHTAACPSMVTTSLAQIESQVTDALEGFFKNTAGVLTGSGSSGSILNEVTKYFQPVCVTACTLTSVDATESVIYTPSGDAKFYSIWNKMATFCNGTGSSSCGSLLSQFRLNVLPKDKCPYSDRQRCVVIPGLKFGELTSGYCTPQIDSGVLSGVGSAVSGYIDDLAKTSIATDIAGGFDSAVGDIQSTWSVFIIVALISFVCGFVYMILLRFLVKPVVYLSILLVLLIFVIGGVVAFIYSRMCADSNFTESSQNLATQVTNSTATECGGQYTIKEKTHRDVLMVSAFVIWFLGLIYCIVICCLWKKIRLAIAINEVAATFVFETPHIVAIPIIQSVIAIVWCGVWMFIAAFLLSQVPDGYVPKDSYATWEEAYGTDDKAGECTGKWPAGAVWKDSTSSDCTASGKCFKCAPPRYMLDHRFFFILFSFLWNNAFFVACGQCIIAGAVGVWFFKPANEKGEVKGSKSGVCTSVKNALVYHPGSLAFGAFILAVVQFLRLICKFLEKQAKQQKNKILACILKCLGYLIWCFEKCIKFLNKNAYIQVALMGTNFCESAKNAFDLILRNAVRFGVMGSLGSVIRFIGKAFIIATTGILGLLVLRGMEPDMDTPVVLVILYCFMGWFIGSLFLNVFGLAVDSTLQCFIATEEMDVDKNFIPDKLKQFIKNAEDAAAGSGKCCGDNCCCICD